jgi:hypothetical protein
MSTQIQDGTVKWEPKDIRVKAIVDLLYPVGTVIAVANDNTPAFTKYGTWEKVGSGRVLWEADSSHPAGTTIEAGLPDITGSFNTHINIVKVAALATGAFSRTADKKDGKGSLGDNMQIGTYSFNASLSNKIYGSSNTVQPPAYVVKFYRRVA